MLCMVDNKPCSGCTKGPHLPERKSAKNNQTSKKNYLCSKNERNRRSIDHLCITIGANILTKETESKSIQIQFLRKSKRIQIQTV
jgi:hypothetical protein